MVAPRQAVPASVQALYLCSRPGGRGPLHGAQAGLARQRRAALAASWGQSVAYLPAMGCLPAEYVYKRYMLGVLVLMLRDSRPCAPPNRREVLVALMAAALSAFQRAAATRGEASTGRPGATYACRYLAAGVGMCPLARCAGAGARAEQT